VVGTFPAFRQLLGKLGPASNYDAGMLFAFDRHTFGGMHRTPFRTSDYGKTWCTRATAGYERVFGYAPRYQGRCVNRNLFFSGTEFGLYVSIDAGKAWRIKGGRFPAGAVADWQFSHAKVFVLATAGTRIWIVIDITPCAP